MKRIKKLKLFFELHWIKVIVITLLVVLAVSLVMLVSVGLKAWGEVESYLKQSQLAMIPLQLYLQVVMGFIFATIYTLLWYWIFMKKGSQSMTQTAKKSIAGGSLGITWNDVIGMDEAKQEAFEIVQLFNDRAQLQRIGGHILR